MRVFVTGASGRLGQFLVHKLVSAGHDVTGLVSSEQKAGPVRAAGASVLLGRLADEDVLAQGLRGRQVVYHLAGGVRGAGPETADLINREGTAHLCAALRKVGRGELTALVFTSSGAVYGDRSGLWVSEDMPPHPQTLYGTSKVAAEKLLLDAARDHGVPTRVARVGAVYGPGFGFTMADPIRAGRCWLPGEGRNYVASLHVDDAISGLLRIAEAGQDGAIYNLADPNPVTLREFYAEVHRLVGGKPARFWSTWIPSYAQRALAERSEQVQARLGRRPRFTPDTLRLYTASARMRVDRLERELGFVWAWPTHTAGLRAALSGQDARGHA